MESYPSMSSTSDSDQVPSERPLLACIRILQLHFHNGGLNKKGYDMLYRMIQMMSAIGWETHIIFCSKIPRGGSLTNMEWYSNCILEGCRVFRRNMKTSISKAMDATESLPDLNSNGPALETKMKLWQSRLSALHTPTGNDRRLFELMLNHYEEVAYYRLIQLNIRKPKYSLEHIVEKVKSVYIALEELQHLAQQADELVLALDQKFRTAINYLPKRRSKAQTRVQQQHSFHAQADEVLPTTVYRPPQDNGAGILDFHLSKSFGFAEEELVRRGHARAATFSETIYTSGTHSAGLVPSKAQQPSQGVSLGARRKGIHVPRIFTGSFSQLESELRKLHLDKVETPVTLDIEDNDPVEVRDFGATPAISPCTTQSSQPLQRREAIVSRDIEFQDRVINGEVVKSRRPSNKGKAQTIDDDNAVLEAWLQDRPSGGGQVSANGSKVRHGSLRDRDKTI